MVNSDPRAKSDDVRSTSYYNPTNTMEHSLPVLSIASTKRKAARIEDYTSRRNRNRSIARRSEKAVRREYKELRPRSRSR